MMHHSSHGNVHGGGGGGGGTAPHVGPPPGPGPLHRHQMHQPIPHQPMPPHQMHHDTRHPMGLTQPSNMGSVGQSMGGMGQQMGIPPPLHGPSRPPHSIRPMAHHAPAQHHSMPPMKTMRRPYHMGGSYGAQAGAGPLQPPPPYQQPPPPPPAHQHHAPPPPPVEVSAEAMASASSEAATCDGAGAGGGDESEGVGADGAGSLSAVLPSSHPLANSKEKTPMCLVNELARFNKIKHQYRLTSETGPAHKKVFTVTLRLGETEEYTAEGSSIKRAQHAAASAALTQTRHTFPPPKLHTHHTPTHQPTRHTGAVMPTVELNALAMKLCEPAVYTSVPPVPAPPPPAGVRYPRFRPPYPPYAPRFHPPHPSAGYPPPPYTQRGGLCGMSRGVAPVYRVRVSVGERAWPGEGPTPQAARHDAAARALHDLRDQVPPDAPPPPPPHSPLPASGENGGGDLLSLDVKSPVSLVHELALKRSLSVLFTVKSERGPPHMRVFVTTCTVGDLETEGEGNGKKMSKKRAAEKMIDEMKQRWPAALLRSSVSRLQQQQRLKRKQMLPKKKPRNLIKENGEEINSEPVSESVDNPISRLAMARHAERARSPQYLVVEERGAPRKREFIVQCDAPPHHATGVGPNKKTAKRRAAHNVLLAMGLGAGAGELLEPVLKNNSIDNDKPIDTKLPTTQERQTAGGGGEVRQPVPGVLLMPDYSHRAAGQPAPPTNGISETAATGSGGVGGVGGSGGGSGGATSPGGSPGAKDQLLYLSQLLGFNVQFSDFPKRNHGEYLSLVALSTVPPVMCHGGGASTQQSHEQCSRAALRALAQMGLDTPSHDTTQGIPGASAKAGILSNGLND